METLFVHLDPDDSGQARWVVLDAAGRPAAAVRVGALDEIAPFTRQRRVLVAVDGRDILLREVELPYHRSRARLAQALPYALEDELAEDIEALHFAMGPPRERPAGEDGARRLAVPVAIVARDRLQARLDVLAAAGLSPHAVVPDVLCLPWQEGEWSLLLDGDRALLRCGPYAGFACERDLLDHLLARSLDEAGARPQRLRLWHRGEAAAPALPDLEIEAETVTDPFTVLARGVDPRTPLNLLQGPFQRKRDYARLVRPYRLPLALAAATLFAAVGLRVLAQQQLAEHRERLEAEIESVYRQVFPNSRNLTAPRRQLENRLAELAPGAAGGPSPLPALAEVADALAEAEGLRLTALQFNGEVLDLDLDAADVQKLDAFKQALAARGLNTELRSASTEGERVRGQVRIRL